MKESDTVAQTLWYTCLNHYTNASREYSVDYIKRALDISQNEFEWIALTVSENRYDIIRYKNNKIQCLKYFLGACKAKELGAYRSNGQKRRNWNV